MRKRDVRERRGARGGVQSSERNSVFCLIVPAVLEKCAPEAPCCDTAAVFVPEPVAIWFAHTIWWKSCFAVAAAPPILSAPRTTAWFASRVFELPVCLISMRCTTSCSLVAAVVASAAIRRAVALFCASPWVMKHACVIDPVVPAGEDLARRRVARTGPLNDHARLVGSRRVLRLASRPAIPTTDEPVHVGISSGRRRSRAGRPSSRSCSSRRAPDSSVRRSSSHLVE